MNFLDKLKQAIQGMQHNFSNTSKASNNVGQIKSSNAFSTPVRNNISFSTQRQSPRISYTPYTPPEPPKIPMTLRDQKDQVRQSFQNNYKDAPFNTPIKIPTTPEENKLTTALKYGKDLLQETGRALPYGFKLSADKAKIGLGVGLDALKNMGPSYQEAQAVTFPFKNLPGADSNRLDRVKQGLLQGGIAGVDKTQQEMEQNIGVMQDHGGFGENLKDPKWVGRMLSVNVPSFLTSLGIGVAVSATTKNPVLGYAAGFSPSYLQNAGDVYNEAKKSGADDPTAMKTANLVGAINGILDTLGISSIINKAGGGKAAGLVVKEILKNMAVAMPEEGVTEGIQQIVQNSIARVYYDHKRDLFAGVPESVFFGTVMGGGGSVSTDIMIGSYNAYQSLPQDVKEGGYISTDIFKKDIESSLQSAQSPEEGAQIIKQEADKIINTSTNQNDLKALRAALNKIINESVGTSGNWKRDYYIQNAEVFGNPNNLHLNEAANQIERIDEIIAKGDINQSKQETLPSDLRNAKPRYGYGDKLYTLNFKNDIDKALYIVGNAKTTSARDSDYMSFLKQIYPQATDVEIRTKGMEVRKSIKQMAAQGDGGELNIPSINMSTPARAENAPAAPVDTAEALGVESSIRDNVNRIQQDFLDGKITIEERKALAEKEFARSKQPETTPDIRIQTKIDPEDTTVVNEAINTVNNATELQDLMDPNYAKADEIIRDFANTYIGDATLQQKDITEIIPIIQEAIAGQEKTSEKNKVVDVPPTETGPTVDIVGEDVQAGPPSEGATSELTTPVAPEQTAVEQTQIDGTYKQPKVAPEIPLGKAVWTSGGVNHNVTVTGYLGLDANGVQYVSVAESKTGVPVEQITFPGKKQSQLIESIKNNEENRSQIKEEAFHLYDTTTDEGRMGLGREYVKNNETAAVERAISNEELTNELIGIYFALDESLQQQADAAQKAGNMAEAERLDSLATRIDNKLAEKVTAPGQILQFLHKWSGRSSQSVIRWANKIHDQANEQWHFKNLIGQKNDFKVTKEMESMIISEMKNIKRISDPKEKSAAMLKLLRTITKDIPPSIMQYTDAYRYENMLSSPRTHMKNSFFNILNTEVLYPSTLFLKGVNNFLFSGITDIFGKPGEFKVSDVGKYYKGQLNGFGTAVSEFGDVMNGTLTALDIQSKYGDNYDTNVASIAALTSENMPVYLQFFKRLLIASDRFMTNIISAGEKDVQLSKGLSEEAANKKAVETATYWLYNNKNDPYNTTGQGPVLAAFDRAKTLISQAGRLSFIGPPIRLFIPFVNIPINVAKMSWEFTPVTGPTTLVGNTRKADQIAKMQMGTLVAFGFMAMAAKGMTAWEPPQDEKGRAAFYASGRKPYSFYSPLTKQWIPVTVLGPLSWAAGIPMAFHHYAKEDKYALTDSQLKQAGAAILSAWKFFAEQTPIQGIGGIAGTLSGDLGTSPGKIIGYNSTQFIPWSSMQRYINSIIDPIFRKGKGFKEEIQKVVVGQTFGMDPHTTPTGEESRRNFSDVAFPISVGDANPEFDAVYKNRVKENQQRAITNEFEKAVESGDILKVSGAKTANGEKLSDADVKSRMKLYFETDSPELQQQIENTLVAGGWSIADAVELTVAADIEDQIKGMSEPVQKLLKRSADYKTIDKLIETYGDKPGAEAIIEAKMKEKGITMEDMIYDSKTNLPDDVQTEEITSIIQGLSNEEMLDTLLSFRRVSEGSRKALLTDTIINKLQKSGVLSKAEATYLKSMEWDGKSKSLIKAKSAGKKPSLVSFKSPSSAKYSPQGTSIQGPNKISLSNLKLSDGVMRKLSASIPKFQKISTNLGTGTGTKISTQIPQMTSSIYQLGKV